MEENKVYICECGKEFDNPQSFNGHKSHCKEHQIQKHGSLEFYEQTKKLKSEKTSSTNKQKSQIKKEQELNQWISEQHTCEKCGKVMIEKFGSGRFCCKSCANSHQKTEESKKNISQIMSNSSNVALQRKEKQNRYAFELQQRQLIYDKVPSRCCICGNALPYKYRYRKTCSINCLNQLMSINTKKSVENHGGNLNAKGSGAYKRGYYHSIKCDSSWELAFVVYQLDHNILVTRNTQAFSYVFENIQHDYYPDFVVDGTYYEIKGYKRANTQAKIDQFPKNLQLVIVDNTTINIYLKYCKENYGIKFWEKLYDQ